MDTITPADPATHTRPLTWQERWDSAAPAPGEPTTWREGLAITAIVVAIIAICVSAGFAVNHWLSDPWAGPNWVTREGIVQDALNAKYVEDIQVHREEGHGSFRGSGGHNIEIFVIDGTLRDDCTVKDDRHPVLTCVGPLHLHGER